MKSLGRILAGILLAAGIGSCNIHKLVPQGRYLLRKNKLNYRHTATIKPAKAQNYILQQPNFYVLGYPVLVGVYSIADPQPDSTYNRFVRRHPGGIRLFKRIFSEKQVYQLRMYYAGLNRQIQAFGQPPVLVDSFKVKRSARNLQLLFKNRGFLDNTTRWAIHPQKALKADVHYTIAEGPRYRIDSVSNSISSPVVKQLYKQIRPRLYSHPHRYYNRDSLALDREKMTAYFRNHGLYDFQLANIHYDIIYDSIPHPYIHLHTLIPDKVFRRGDSILTRPFLPFRYDSLRIRIVRDIHTRTHRPARIDTLGKKLFFYPRERRFRSELLARSLFLHPDSLYSDRNLNRTREQLMNLENFWQIYINHFPKNDSLLDAEIVLVPNKRFGTSASVGVSRSNIRPLGISFEGAVTWRNVFHGFENLSLSVYSLWASSIRFNLPKGNLNFNVRETGIDLNLRIPRIIAPKPIQRLIPMYMRPKTHLGLRYNTQTNIGLDRQKIYFLYGYEWRPNHIVTNTVNPLEINHVNYKNPDQYFEIYSAAFDRLNQIAQTYYGSGIDPGQADDFIHTALNDPALPADVRNTIRQIYERKTRLTENVLIINSNYRLLYDTRSSLTDPDFWMHKFYLGFAGWLPGLVSKITPLPENNVGQRTVNGVPYAQFVKAEYSYIRHWELSKNNILAARFYTGLAVPFGNSRNVPFVEAFYAGGSTDIRAWRAFELGPGSTGGIGDFNEANFKLMANAEWRFGIMDAHRGALFVDAGNIWNLWDDIPYEKAKFHGWQSLRDIGIGAGFGYRYDFGFFALRLDYAFKIYDPAYPLPQRWKWPRITDGTLQLGINYPF